VGDLLTLTGTNYAAGEAQVTVNFGSIPIAVPPDSDTQISVTVPPGAISGPVTVTTTAMVNGQPLVQTSNPEDILVIWKDFDLTPILTSFSDGFDGLWPGSADDLYVKIGSYWLGGGPPVLIHVKADGSWDWTPDYDHGVMNPVNNTWAYFTDTYDTTCLEYPAGQQSVCTCRAYEDCWVLGEAAFDGAGNIYVDAGTTGDLLGIWRFGPGEPIVLDPNSANCLTPGGVPVLFGSCDLTVAADGTVYFLPALSQNQSCGEYVQSLMKIPAGGGAYQIFPLPSIPDCDDSAWMLVTNCMGHSFAFNYGYAVTDPNSPQYLFSVPDNTPIATLGGPSFQISDYYPITTDGYGDFYYAGRDTNTNHWLIRRVLPSDLPAGFYDNFTCCPTDVQYKDVVQKSRGENVQLSCSALTINISQQGSQTIPVTQNGQNVTLPLGAMPTLALLSNNQPVSATWSLQNPSRNNPADPDDLFPNDVALLFPPNGSSGAGLAILHLGSFQITATSGQNSLSFTVKTVETGALGSDPAGNPYDAAIYASAERFGIPPEYIKGCIARESGFAQDLTRYEPRTWDFTRFRTRLNDPYYAAFCFDEPSIPGVSGSPIVPGTWVMAWKDTRVKGFDPSQSSSGPIFSYEKLDSWANWSNGAGCAPASTADTDVSAYSLVLGSSAWVLPPTNPPYQSGPCGVGWDWYKTPSAWVAVYLYDQYGSQGDSGSPYDSLDFFYNNKNYNAQTVLASSYGLMQVGFEGMKYFHRTGWMPADTPLARTAANFMTPDQDIQVGCWVLTDKRHTAGNYYPSDGRTSLGDFQSYFVTLFSLYNGASAGSSGSLPMSYGQDVVLQRAPAYLPALAVTPPAP